jgi:hypothetical protein
MPLGQRIRENIFFRISAALILALVAPCGVCWVDANEKARDNWPKSSVNER